MTTVDANEESDNLHDRVLAMVHAFAMSEPAPEPTDALACDIARFQARNIPGFARLCARYAVDADKLVNAADIPAVPTDAFKLTRVFAFADGEPVVFQTSGTTVGRRGRHIMRGTDTYDRAALAFGHRMLMPPTLGIQMPFIPVLVLGPPPSEQPDSSLTHMLSMFAERMGSDATGQETYFLRDGVFELARLDERVARMIALRDSPVLLLGTSFAFVHFLDAMGADTFQLPTGSRVMQTGGFKGKSREVPASELRREIARVFCIEEGDVMSEYGMTELSSQFYTRAGADALAGIFSEPPWARVTPVVPETLEPVEDGEIGIARIVDLCNVDSAVAIQTQDLVRREGNGFVLLGRLPGAAPRGCSIAIDEMVGPS